VTTDARSVTVVGNGVAGYACAARLATRGVRVTLVGPGFPADRPPLSKSALSRGMVPYLATARSLLEAGITHLDGWAESPDLGRRELVFSPQRGGPPRRVQFETLVWATGLRPSPPPVPGIAAAHQNAHPAGLGSLLPHLVRPGRRVVVVGAGLIGTETAATLSLRHAVSLLERAARPLDRLHPAISAAATAALEGLGVAFTGACEIEGIEAGGGSPHLVRTSTHGSLEADLVIAAAGVRSTVPAELGGGASLETDERLAVVGQDDVWACGDVASFPHPRFGRLTIPHWDNAHAGGRHVADAILGSPASYTRDPYWFSDVGPLRIQQVGFAHPACEWTESRGLHVGRGADGTPACVVLLNAPHRLKEARSLLAAA
jgi:3-phenylpropionate/trans-cinnamate dioxygenase ferredoxin reductase component